MPTMTVLDARNIVHRRVGEYVVLADLDDALAESARQVGLSPAATARLVDDDLLLLAAADHDEFLKVAELRAWESILGNANDMGLRDAAIDESPATVREAARERIKALSGYVKDVYCVGLAPVTLGVVGLDFQAGVDDVSESRSGPLPAGGAP